MGWYSRAKKKVKKTAKKGVKIATRRVKKEAEQRANKLLRTAAIVGVSTVAGVLTGGAGAAPAALLTRELVK